MSIDVSDEIKLNIRMALLGLAVIMTATIIGTGYNTWHLQNGARDQKTIREEMGRLRDADRKTNGRIDYLRRSVHKRLSELEKRAEQ